MRTTGSLIEKATNGILACAALVMLGIYLHDRSSPLPTRRGAGEPIAIEGWQNELDSGISMGPSDAPVVIVEFMDFQCPFCRRLVARLDSLESEFPGQVRVVLHHYPLENHPLALPAAIAAECADRQGRFKEFYDLAFEHQSEYAAQSWTSLALAAGVADGDAFNLCVALPLDSFPRIAYGRDLGARTGVIGTPTVWVNGYRELSPPTLERLRVLVREVVE